MDWLFNLEYGDEVLEGVIPKEVVESGRLVKLERADPLPPLEDLEGAVENALEELQDYENGIVTIVVDDHTRPNVHTRALLPILLKALQERGVEKEDIKILLASGTHDAPGDEGFYSVMGKDVYEEYKNQVAVHNFREGNASIGETEDGIPIEVNELAYNSKLLILLTDITYHSFSGYGGGPKSICPGLTGEATSKAEHMKMFCAGGFAEGLESGKLEGNPVFACKKKIVEKIIQGMKGNGSRVFGITCVINPYNDLVYVNGGEVFESHSRARDVLDKTNSAKIEERADMVVVSAKTYGRDMYRSEKALHAASKAVKEGGRILLLAPCQLGFNNKPFEDCMELAAGALGPDKDIEGAITVVNKDITKNFEIGKQKVLDLLRILKMCGKGHIAMVEDGLSEHEKGLLPFELLEEGSAIERGRGYLAGIEENEPGLKYCLIEDPHVLVRVKNGA